MRAVLAFALAMLPVAGIVIPAGAQPGDPFQSVAPNRPVPPKPSLPAATHPVLQTPAAAPANECDRLAQPPRSMMGRLPTYGEGVELGHMDVAAALAACDRAVREFPDEPRFRDWLGHVLQLLERRKEAVAAYQQAADKGYPIAQNDLAYVYRYGYGVEQSDAEAVRLFALAAEQGLPMAQANYLAGEGVASDRAEALRLFREAARHGIGAAQTNLRNLGESW